MGIVSFPELEQHTELKGVFVGGCVDRGEGSSFRAQGHAHTHEPNKGWICVRSAKRLRTPSGQPSQLILHELAHIIVGHSHGHDHVWMLKADELGCWHAKQYKSRSPVAYKRYRKIKRQG